MESLVVDVKYLLHLSGLNAVNNFVNYIHWRILIGYLLFYGNTLTHSKLSCIWEWNPLSNYCTVDSQNWLTKQLMNHWRVHFYLNHSQLQLKSLILLKRLSINIDLFSATSEWKIKEWKLLPVASRKGTVHDEQHRTHRKLCHLKTKTRI